MPYVNPSDYQLVFATSEDGTFAGKFFNSLSNDTTHRNNTSVWDCLAYRCPFYCAQRPCTMDFHVTVSSGIWGFGTNKTSYFPPLPRFLSSVCLQAPAFNWLLCYLPTQCAPLSRRLLAKPPL